MAATTSPNALWARGNCWVTIAIPEFIELLDLPAGRRACASSCSRPTCSRSARCVKHQDASGLWHTLIDDPGSYLEAPPPRASPTASSNPCARATSAGIRGDRRARREGRARATSTRRGELKHVSFGTPVFNDLDGYRKIPLTSMPYGQAMAILALGEFKRTFI